MDFVPYYVRRSAAAIAVVIALQSVCASGASYRTQNFVVTAATAELAQKAGTIAEKSRRQLAMSWLGEEIPNWDQPCRLTIRLADQPSGSTSFDFHNGRALGWQILVCGPIETVLASVLPHEINHAVIATHFGRSLPRWADEGMATLCEDQADIRRQAQQASDMLAAKQTVPLRSLMSMEDYPDQQPRLFSLYVFGYSLTDYLVQNGGRARFVKFLHEAEYNGWDSAVVRYYKFASIDELEKSWLESVRGGSIDSKSKTPQTEVMSASLDEADAPQTELAVGQ